MPKPHPLQSHIGPRDFALWRRRMGYSYAQAGQALGLSRRHVIRYEKGEEPVPGDPSKVRDIPIPRVVALACAALAAGLDPIGETKPSANLTKPATLSKAKKSR